MRTESKYSLATVVPAAFMGRSVSVSVESALQIPRWSILQKGSIDGPRSRRNTLSHATERCVSEGSLLTQKWWEKCVILHILARGKHGCGKGASFLWNGNHTGDNRMHSYACGDKCDCQWAEVSCTHLDRMHWPSPGTTEVIIVGILPQFDLLSITDGQILGTDGILMQKLPIKFEWALLCKVVNAQSTSFVVFIFKQTCTSAQHIISPKDLRNE